MTVQGLYGEGKSRGKCRWHLGQEKSEKLAMVRGKIALLYCKSGGKCHL